MIRHLVEWSTSKTFPEASIQIVTSWRFLKASGECIAISSFAMVKRYVPHRRKSKMESILMMYYKSDHICCFSNPGLSLSSISQGFIEMERSSDVTKALRELRYDECKLYGQRLIVLRSQKYKRLTTGLVSALLNRRVTHSVPSLVGTTDNWCFFVSSDRKYPPSDHILRAVISAYLS